MIELPAQEPLTAAIWQRLISLTALQPEGWTLVGAQMVALHAHEQGRPPPRTVLVPGGTQALRRTQLVDVRLGELKGQVPRPDLLGAILVKARAVAVDDVPDAQREDLAFLLTLVSDPRELAAELRGKERSWLRRRKELLERTARPWRRLPDDDADNGHIAFRIIAGL